jgi:hypothetical protein
VNIQESAILIALNKVAKEKELYLENYWMKNKRSVEKGRDGPVYGWVIPHEQAHRVNAAEMVNDLRHQGVEVVAAPADGTYGDVKVAAGDYLIRADQPYRTLVDLYFSLQNYPVTNPLPYDDTGWTMPLMRNVTVRQVKDKSLLDKPMTVIAKDVAVPGVINGAGDILVVENNTDNVLTTFRFQNPEAKNGGRRRRLQPRRPPPPRGRLRHPQRLRRQSPPIDRRSRPRRVRDRIAQRQNAPAYRPAHWLRA